MSTLKKSISIVLAILMLISVFTAVPLTAGAAETHKRHTKANTEKKPTGDTIQSGDYYYYLYEDGTAEISYYIGSDTDLVIPDALDGHKVVSIDEQAFDECESIQTIKIPDSVTHIGADAFEYTGYYNNEDNWEDGVLYIGKFLIKADNMKGTYTVKNGTTVIADDAFYEYHENEDYVNSDDYDYRYSDLESIVIPSSVTHIGIWSFYNCDKLTKVTLSDGLEYIDDEAFGYCSALKNIALPSSVTHIGDGVFYECSNLESVTLPDGITNISESLFKYCSKLNSITIPSGVTEIGAQAFYDTGIYNNDSNWTNGVLYIGKNLVDTNFYVAPGPYTVKSGTEVIADFAFDSCNNITSVTFPDSVKYINYCAFYDCIFLKNITIGKNVKEIGAFAFYGTDIKSVTIPANVTTIGDRAFGYYEEKTVDLEGDTTYTEKKVTDFTINGYEKTEAETYASANGFKFVKLTPPKKVKQANTLKVSAKTKAVKAKKLKKKKQTVKPLTIKNAKGAVTVTKVKKGSTAKIFKKIKVNKKTGAITIKKGKYAKKTYKIKLKITANGNSDYNSKTLTKVVKIKVK